MEIKVITSRQNATVVWASSLKEKKYREKHAAFLAEGVKLVNCKLLNTDLAFEFSTVDAEVTTEIDSVKNPIAGRIAAKSIKEIILDENLIDVTKTEIVTKE